MVVHAIPADARGRERSRIQAAGTMTNPSHCSNPFYRCSIFPTLLPLWQDLSAAFWFWADFRIQAAKAMAGITRAWLACSTGTSLADVAIQQVSCRVGD